MASSDVDQKYLGRVAHFTEQSNPVVSEALYQILGLSVVLSRKLFRARKLRKLDTSRDTKSLQLYHHIIWLSREGLSILEVWVLPYTQAGEEGPECQVLAAKLRASFVHIFCLFHNNPPITVASVPAVPANAGQGPPSPRAEIAKAQQGEKITPPKRNSRGKQPSLRDPIASITSDASFLTNPYAGLQPGSTPPPTIQQTTPSYPPGLAAVSIPQHSAFLLPSINYIPLASDHFRIASATAAALLPGAHPLRLSTSIEHAAFLWDCVHDEEGARLLARRAIRQLREREEEGVTDEGFEDAAEMVQILGRIMKRKSADSTPRTGQQEIDARASEEHAQGQASAAQAAVPTQSTTRVRPPIPQQQPPLQPQPPATAPATPRRSRDAGPGPASSLGASPLRQPPPPKRYPAEFAPPPTPPKTTELPTPPRQTPPRQTRQTPPRSTRSARDTKSPARSANSPGIEGGPVGGVSRRESTKTSSSHRRATSTQVSPSTIRTAQRPSTSSSSRRRRTEEYGTSPLGPGRVLDYGRATPPHPPPKDPGYTPSIRSGGKQTAPTSRRASTATSRRVAFDGNGQQLPQRVDEDEPYTNGHGNGTNGHYDTAAADGRGRGER